MNKFDYLKNYIREVPDFPTEGISFKDITPLLREGEIFGSVIDNLSAALEKYKLDVITAPESRGFIFGTAVAKTLGLGFVPIRKPNKLPFKTVSHTYDLEYGVDTLSMHIDGIQPGQKVGIVDDVLATGGTIKACSELIKMVGGNPVIAAFVMELKFLAGASKIDTPVYSMISYEK